MPSLMTASVHKVMASKLDKPYKLKLGTDLLTTPVQRERALYKVS